MFKQGAGNVVVLLADVRNIKQKRCSWHAEGVRADGKELATVVGQNNIPVFS
jgi:hypothetical protein